MDSDTERAQNIIGEKLMATGRIVRVNMRWSGHPFGNLPIPKALDDNTDR